MRVDSEPLKRSILRARARSLFLRFGLDNVLDSFSLRVSFFHDLMLIFDSVSMLLIFWITKNNFVLFHKSFFITANAFSLIGKKSSSEKECNFGNFRSFYGFPPGEILLRHSNRKINNLFCRN